MAARYCSVCKSKIPDADGPGRRSEYCDAEATGRPCREVAKNLRLAGEGIDRILRGLASGDRGPALYWYRAALRTLKDDVSSDA